VFASKVYPPPKLAQLTIHKSTVQATCAYLIKP
jgi:hypothetical protein